MDIEPILYNYTTILMTEDGKRYDISNLIENLGWEEPEKELAARITFTAKNDKVSKSRLSSLAKPGCFIFLMYSYQGKNKKEAVRGKIEEWNPSAKLTADEMKIKAYDELRDLQESEDDIYYSSGIGTRSAITQIFDKWKIPLESYSGPDITHGKLRYCGQKLGSVIVKILDEAKKKGGGKAIIRAVKGKVKVMSYGENKTVYHFEEAGNLISISDKITLSGMVTRVKVLGEADDDDRRPLEATVDGDTKYGIRQKVYKRGNDESLEDAKKAAQEILDEKGKPEEEIKVQAPDMPDVRKGDLIHMKSSAVGTGYFHVLSINHDCDSGKMTMTLEKTKKKENSSSKNDKKNYSIGDTVNFHGGTYYVSSDASSGYNGAAGKATITYTNPGSAHPWHLEYINWEETHVYGWVNEGTFD